MKWLKRRKLPLLKLTVSLIVGIVVAHQWSDDVTWLIVLAAAAAVVLLLLRRALLLSMASCLGFLALGFFVGRPAQLPPVPASSMQEAVVMSELTEKPKTMMMDLYLPRQQQTRRCYVWKDAASQQLRLGESLLVFLRDDRFVPPGRWQRGGDGLSMLTHLQRVRLKALLLRHRLLQRYQALQAGSEQYAILAAMTLGDKSALTKELRQTYAVTGASHVLALSGLHLGIIYLLLTRLLGSSRRSWLRQVFFVVCIWGFAFLTGLSASLVRAATMLTVYSLFSLGGRGHSSLNVLCFTAMVMLLCQSDNLFDVGFQLSFLSMFSILLFTPYFDRLFAAVVRQRNTMLTWAWGLCSVSLAAQLGVGPLISYYFGRFATYFLLTNFIVIPAATIIIYGALLSLLVPQLATLLVYVVKALNAVLGLLSQLPLSSIEGLHPTVLQVVLSYVVIGCLYLILRIVFTYIPASGGYR